MFTGLIISAVMLKIIFHHLPLLAKILPESCVLIVVGIFAGVLIHYVILDDILNIEDKTQHPFPQFTAPLFFEFLLPPIILDAALALYDDAFFDNFVSIMIFAIFGTLFNTFAIGYSIYGLASTGALGAFEVNNTVTHMMEEKELTATECLIFSSLISAVDPVAVLAIFEEIHVNIGLYFLVFGESLFNDGVTVVLYNTMIALVNMAEVGATEILMAFLSFFCVVLGGAGIGLLNGLYASVVTRFTRHVRVVEPLIIFSSAYFAFLGAELFHWSGIISIIAYGITVKRYGFQNLSKKSYTTVKYAIKTLASVSDCIIFIFLGLELIQESHYLHPGFIIATILLCLLFRFISVFMFGFLVNIFRMDKIEMKEQFIMAYGGLRGAVGFSLAVVIEHDVWYRELFISAALVMVFFTVFLQGGTIKLFVKLFNIDLQSKEKDKTICYEIQGELMEDVMDGVENIVGVQKAVNWISTGFSKLDQVLKKLIVHSDSQVDLQRKFEKMMLEEHITNLYAPRILAQTTATDGFSDPDSGAAPQSANKDARKSFKKAVKKSQWQTFKVKNYQDPTYLKKDIASHLNNKAKRSQTMGAKALEQLWSKGADTNSLHLDQAQSVQRTRSSNSEFGRKMLSTNAHLIKDFYDEVQQNKKQTPVSSPSNHQRTFFKQMSHPNPTNLTIDEVDETFPLNSKESKV